MIAIVQVHQHDYNPGGLRTYEKLRGVETSALGKIIKGK